MNRHFMRKTLVANKVNQKSKVIIRKEIRIKTKYLFFSLFQQSSAYIFSVIIIDIGKNYLNRNSGFVSGEWKLEPLHWRVIWQYLFSMCSHPCSSHLISRYLHWKNYQRFSQIFMCKQMQHSVSYQSEKKENLEKCNSWPKVNNQITGLAI